MPFNSLSFILFFSSFFLLYWGLFQKHLTIQNLFILTGSYLFYAWWDWRFLFLLILNSALTWFLGIQMQKTEKERERNVLLWIGLLQGLGSLFFFKLRGFLPLGISFYTFRTTSYLLDIKRNKTEAVTNWLKYFCYVAFFPCITAGPIDRAGTLVPQLSAPRTFRYDQASDGMRQILWGVFKKAVIADNCAFFTSGIFDGYQHQAGSTLVLGALLYAVQIYADFSGYSDIAIGLSSMLGFNVTRNFNYPFFARNIVDYWRRWHMSLTSWLTDYVFLPLSIAFRDHGKAGLTGAIIINFVLIGFWHGASWTYVAYGFLNGCCFIPAIIRGTMNKRYKGTGTPGFSFRALSERICTFLLVAFLLVLFRADSLTQALGYWRGMFSASLFSKPVLTDKLYLLVPLFFIFPMFLTEWRQRDKRHALQLEHIPRFALRAAIYLGLITVILVFSATKNEDFIYFKF